MFTGIIQKRSNIVSTHDEGEVLRVQLQKPDTWELSIGQSVAVDGICSTVVSFAPDSFDVQYIPETLAKTTAGSFRAGRVVNLERSLKLTDFVDGHLVQGHVDAAVKVTRVSRELGHRLSVSVPDTLRRFVAPLGSIAINGVSLTVAEFEDGVITVALIPETLESTNLGTLTAGDAVNLEVDVIARYVAAQTKK